MYPLDPVIEGAWEFGLNYPDAIEIEGHHFNRAIRQQAYQDTVAQYRESVARDSMHLLVLTNGTWVIDHVDEYNPDMGHPIRHFLVDHPKGIPVVLTGIGALGMMGAALANKKGKDSGTKV
jgi:hypothetical protein